MDGHSKTIDLSNTNLKSGTKWVRTALVSRGGLTQALAYHSYLHIEISEFRLRFFVAQAGECVWLEDYASDMFLTPHQVLENLKLLVFDHPVLALTGWKAIHITVSTDGFTLIPDSLFRKEYAARYLQLTQGHPVLATNKALHEHLPALGMYSVFQMPAEWWNFFQDHFALQPLFFSHICTPLLLGALRKTDASKDTQVFLQFQEGFFIALVLEKKKLQFCNRFRFHNPEEATFFVLSFLNELNYLPEGVELCLSGETTPFSGVFGELARFLPHIFFAKKPRQLAYPDEFEDLADHRYFALLNCYELSGLRSEG